MDAHVQLTLNVALLTHAHRHITATHVRDHGFELTPLAIEKGDLIIGLKPQNLHMPSSAWRQIQGVTWDERRWTMKAWQV